MVGHGLLLGLVGSAHVPGPVDCASRTADSVSVIVGYDLSLVGSVPSVVDSVPNVVGSVPNVVDSVPDFARCWLSFGGCVLLTGA